jgi:hypothetical protein
MKDEGGVVACLFILHPSAFILLQQDVRRLEVAVDNAVHVGVIDGAGQRFHQAGRVPGRQRCTGQAFRQRFARDIFQREVWLAVGVADFMNLDDVWMLQPGRGFGFGAEAGPLLIRRRRSVPDHLQGHQAVEAQLAGPVDHPHAAAAQQVEHLVAGHLGQVLRGRPSPRQGRLDLPARDHLRRKARAVFGGRRAVAVVVADPVLVFHQAQHHVRPVEVREALQVVLDASRPGHAGARLRGRPAPHLPGPFQLDED